MYIDYTHQPLEEELHRLLNNPATAAAILAEAGIAVSGDERADSTSKNVQIQFADELNDQEEEYDYILKKVPRSSRRPRRATPGLIPAAEFLESINGSAAGSSASVQTNCKRRQKLTNGYSEYELAGASSSGRSSVISHYQTNSTLPMGFDIIDKIRHFLNFGTNRVGDESVDLNRKRRAESDSRENVASQIKYRKVESQFPKIIPRPFEEDVEAPSCSRINAASISNQNFIFGREPSKGFTKYSSNMSQQKKYVQDNQEFAQNHRRNSLFNEPRTIHKQVTNAPFADIEFSDDEEGEIIGSFNLNERSNSGNKNTTQIYRGLGETSGNSRGRLVQPAKFCNIPIAHVDQLVGKMGISSSKLPRRSDSRPPPPPLIEARTGEYLALKLLPDLKPIRQHNGNLIKHDLEMYQNCQHNDRVLNERAGTCAKNARVFSSQATTSPSMNGGLISKVKQMANWRSSARSVIAQEQQNKDRERYSELLKKMMPLLYGNEETPLKGLFNNASPFASTKKTSNIIPSTRKSIVQQQREYQHSPKPIATISLTDDENDYQDDDVMNTTTDNAANMAIINDGDDDICEVIDLNEDERNILSACSKLDNCDLSAYDQRRQSNQSKIQLPYVEPVNSFQEQLDMVPVCKSDWLANFKRKWEVKTQERNRALEEATKEVEECAAERKKAEREVQERFRNLDIVDPDLVVLDEFPDSDISEDESEEGEPDVIEFTPEQKKRIQFAISGARNDILITKFNMSITRRDIETLLNLSWLNDEVINYYMNLLIERSEKRQELPKVYSMNTFFVPRLMEGGHAAVRRWTRKVNIFDRDIIPVPVHVGGVHWCMAIIHLKNQTIKYYDSMGTPNPRVLAALEKYLQDESLDKLKKPFDTSQFEIDSVRDVPRQMNGSDCGVFSCMFAEYITRNREITFTQEHMPYFRQKMILEITQGELLL